MVQTSSRLRAARRITAASIPNGAEKKTVESRAASATTPTGVANRPIIQREKAPILSRTLESKVKAKAQGQAKMGNSGLKGRSVRARQSPTIQPSRKLMIRVPYDAFTSECVT